ncbi:MAG TPA: zinc ribbon domain-containing protein [Anaerolineaceae bacterium]|nr:zinc ribbon domain-containing protein [Anaerolineaceae bacterium]
MNLRIYHGEVTPEAFARALFARYNAGNYQVKAYGNESNLDLQILTRPGREAGGEAGLTVNLSQVVDGVSVRVGKPRLLGLAANLGRTALDAFRNPLSLLGNLDDIAQDVESAQLEEAVWSVIDKVARQNNAGEALSERLNSVKCPYCLTANKIGEGNCQACGAPLGDIQPTTCRRCGYVLYTHEKICPNCGTPTNYSG